MLIQMGQNNSISASYEQLLIQTPSELAAMAKQSAHFSDFVVEKIEEFGISGELVSELEESDLYEHCSNKYTKFEERFHFLEP